MTLMGTPTPSIASRSILVCRGLRSSRPYASLSTVGATSSGPAFAATARDPQVRSLRAGARGAGRAGLQDSLPALRPSGGLRIARYALGAWGLAQAPNRKPN